MHHAQKANGGYRPQRHLVLSSVFANIQAYVNARYGAKVSVYQYTTTKFVHVSLLPDDVVVAGLSSSTVVVVVVQIVSAERAAVAGTRCRHACRSTTLTAGSDGCEAADAAAADAAQSPA